MQTALIVLHCYFDTKCSAFNIVPQEMVFCHLCTLFQELPHSEPKFSSSVPAFKKEKKNDMATGHASSFSSNSYR